jgi:hypothetical protein
MLAASAVSYASDLRTQCRHRKKSGSKEPDNWPELMDRVGLL